MFKPWQVILFLLVVVLGVVGFIFWYYSVPGPANNADTTVQLASTTPDAMAPAPQQSTGPSTDAGLDADLNAVDTQMKVVDTNSAAVDQSLNDKPVTQTE